GGTGADAGRVRARVGAGLHGVHGALGGFVPRAVKGIGRAQLPTGIRAAPASAIVFTISRPPVPLERFRRRLGARGQVMDSWLVAYDISDPKRLRKVALTCEDFGARTQYSVFLCRLSATDFVRLRSRLYDLIDLEEDQVQFIPLCAKCVHAIEAIG